MSITRRDFLRLSAYGFGTAFLAACGFRPGDNPPPINPTELPALSPTVISQALTELGFEAFADQVKVYQDAQYLYVESNGMPAHPMMIGIKSWQQQVPLPQPFTGSNAWKIPLHPVVAENPISAKTDLYRGAIALAVNGVPIFNALNNRGDDAYLYGELDEFGGHAGRADDYHYHTAPLHLSELVGIDKPIAYALDGFPIYGLTEPDGTAVTDLDEFNGHFAADGSYHYHGTKTYPYINGGMRGVVTVRDDQIEPQPRMTPIREALQPLQGATITNFTELDSSHYSLEYQISGQKYYVNYGFEGNTYTFEFVDASGKKTIETYTSHN
ncbi:YHYH protein [Candidatus Villigracilis affinis]|uniref:YHYH protein n=1 Tax=Candidatus Villigracilis affinis TaxID=3140682 RepID=UPI001DA64061|nr:YHYH protein [Anaerolineales bacterium]